MEKFWLLMVTLASGVSYVLVGHPFIQHWIIPARSERGKMILTILYRAFIVFIYLVYLSLAW